MDVTSQLEDKTVIQPSDRTWLGGVFERLVTMLLDRFSVGGLRVEYASGQVKHFGKPGAEVTASIRLHDDEEFFRRTACHGNIGLGEAYSDGIWDTDDIAAVISWFIDNVAATQGARGSSTRLPQVNWMRVLHWFDHMRRANTLENSRRNISEHYDLGNDFYQLWLDPTMTYSSAYFTAEDQPLEQAQTAKYDALCRKLQLKPGDRVLEIGCGWGGFAVHAATNYGCSICGLTLSNEQAAYARDLVKSRGLEEQIEIRIQDYRHVTGTFDKIASIEMLEAVGDRYHESFFAKCAEVLTPNGLLGVQMITVPDCSYESLRKNVDWIQRHIFPGSLLLSVGRINQVLQKTGDLFMHDLEDLGADYARTLATWHDSFNAKLPEVRALGFDTRFIRSWNYYLKYCEAAFATRNISVVQAVYTRPNNASLHHRCDREKI